MVKDAGNFSLEEMLEASKGSIYKLTMLAAKRAVEISDGDKAMVEKPDEKVLDDALKEIAAGKIKVKNNKKQ